MELKQNGEITLDQFDHISNITPIHLSGDHQANKD